MPRPPIPLRKDIACGDGFVEYINRTLNSASHRFMALWDLIRRDTAHLSRKEIAEINRISTRTLSKWVKLFNEGGYEALLSKDPLEGGKPRGRRPKITSEIYKERIAPRLPAFRDLSTGRVSAADLYRRLKGDSGLLISYSTLVRVLKRNGVELRKSPGHQPPENQSESF